jgi:hypothetical protein
MKKIVIAFLSTCIFLSVSSAAYAAAPMTEKKHEQKMHAKGTSKTTKVHAKGFHAKSIKAKAITGMPKTGFGGASEQSE